MTHPLALALLRAEAAAYRASEGVTGAHPDDPPHPAMPRTGSGASGSGRGVR